MRTTLDLDEQLVKSAMRETGARTKTELIETALRLLLEKRAQERLIELKGSMPGLHPARRRRV